MAFFVKKYTDSNNFWLNARKVIKVSDGYLVLGAEAGGGYITKTDSIGTVEWSKRYAPSSQQLRFDNGIDVGDGIQVLYHLYDSTDTYSIGLCKIDYNGNILASKQYFSSLNHPFSNTFQRIIRETDLYLHNGNLTLLVVDFVRHGGLRQDTVYKYTIDQSNNVLSSDSFSLPDKFSTNEIRVLPQHILFVGEGTFRDAMICKLGKDANTASLSTIENTNPDISIGSLKCSNLDGFGQNFFITGFHTLVGSGTVEIFIAKIDMNDMQVLSFKYFSGYSFNDRKLLEIIGGHLYYMDSKEGLHKLNMSTEISWIKKFSEVAGTSDLSAANEVMSTLIDSHLAITDLNLDSCITSNISEFPSFIANNDFNTLAQNSLSLSPFTEAATTVSLTPAAISLTTEEICSVMGGSDPDLTESTIEANPEVIVANGTSTSNITVTLRDAAGIIINPSTYDVDIDHGGVGTLSDVTNNGDGTYNATLTSSTTVETATLEFTVVTIGTSTNVATVDFIAVNIQITDDTALQSPHLYLQAAGSEGDDSTKGRHLRWTFRGALGEKHLPKGNNAGNTVNFNKPSDFVNIYRAPFTAEKVTLSFALHEPEVIDHSNYLWIYRVSGKEFYVHFRNQTEYDQILTTINPATNPQGFLVQYSGELIEIESKKELFFAATVNLSGLGLSSELKVETLSVNENLLTANKTVSNRRHFTSSQLGSAVRFVCENGRSLRGQSINCNATFIEFEFYSDFIVEANANNDWQFMGAYALTLNDATALTQLEPTPGDVHGVWQRFNDDAFVNINNYEEKWNGPSEPGDRNIKEVVDKYIDISDDINNPTAIESIPLGNDPTDPNDNMEVSNLDLLNLAASDYHIARLLGLGTLDIDEGTVIGELNPDYVYVAEYFTIADLEDGQGVRDVHHLFMSLPTANTDARLPVPVELSNIEFGVFIGAGSGTPTPLTDLDGYTHDCTARYVSIYNQDLPLDQTNVPFFVTPDTVNKSTITNTIYGGIEYRKGLVSNWQKPELSKDVRYFNAVPVGEDPHFETRFLVIPETPTPYFVHRQTATGTHIYSSYGINWFSRAKSSTGEIPVETVIKPKNPLTPPSKTHSHLIRNESPLLLTSEEEQQRLGSITDPDKTLIRLAFDYHTYQELKDYKVGVDSTATNEDLVDPANANDPDILFPDNLEIHAEEIDIFFRNEVPNNVRGKALSVSEHPSDNLMAIIHTGDYYIASTDQTITPEVPVGTEQNFIGGLFNIGNKKYLIQEVNTGATGPDFTVYKVEISESIVAGGIPSGATNGVLELPEIVGDGYFMAVENMQSPDSWGTPNPLPLKVKVGGNEDWGIHREVIEYIDDDGDIDRHVEKTRGIWSLADNGGNEHTLIESLDIDGNVTTENTGMYKITFHGIRLDEHIQYFENTVSVEWYQGIIRLFTEGAHTGGVPNQRRKALPVLKIENVIRVGDSPPFSDLVVYAQDPAFSSDGTYDPIQTGDNIEAHFYPGYKVYLYKDTPNGLDEANILPEEGEGMSYSIFGFRSHDLQDNHYSKISVPTLMFAQELIPAIPPELPEGPLYATRPDFFGRSTYTLTTRYQHKPHGVLFYRSNDEALLNALYEKSTILQIREQLALLGGNEEEYLTNRWENFLNFEELEMDGDYKVYPPADVSPDGYKFPNPDKQALFDWANGILAQLELDLITEAPGELAVGDIKIRNFVKGFIYNAFVPLTEVPVLYQYLNASDYQPVAKKQVIRDRDGHILPPFDPKDPMAEPSDFDMAPMMKIIDESPHETLYTDFNLDGTSNNLYFYGVKELSTQMKMSDFSPFLGPIKLVNTNAPETPEVKRIVPVLGNELLGLKPKIKLEVNAFPGVQNIKKLAVYRATNKLNAQSVRTMDLVKVFDLEEENLLGEPIWTVEDFFEDLTEVPYGDPLLYRITALRKVEYAEIDGIIVTEYAPSQASKIVASVMVEVSAPPSPDLFFSSTWPDANDEIMKVALQWAKTAYNAKYHVYKMNSQGNWAKIHDLQSNLETITLPLLDTTLQSDTLSLVLDGVKTYHHFKVITENTSGMLSKEENILTIFDEDKWIET